MTDAGPETAPRRFLSPTIVLFVFGVNRPWGDKNLGACHEPCRQHLYIEGINPASATKGRLGLCLSTLHNPPPSRPILSNDKPVTSIFARFGDQAHQRDESIGLDVVKSTILNFRHGEVGNDSRTDV